MCTTAEHISLLPFFVSIQTNTHVFSGFALVHSREATVTFFTALITWLRENTPLLVAMPFVTTETLRS